MDFKGKICPVCSKEFENDDDIVVCPKCGAPYHRDCYSIEGKCIFPDLHRSKQSWKEVYDKSLDETTCRCRVEVIKVSLHVLYEVVQLAEQPTIEVGTVFVSDISFLVFESVNIGIHGEECIGLLQLCPKVMSW